ncbi:MAG TPA: short-chain dehydrogenase, partial [Chloroflexota bacterium]
VKGALPILYAATADDVSGGAFYGPDGLAEQRGYPKRVSAAARANDEDTAQRLWQVSEELTGVRYDLLDGVPVRPAADIPSPA